MELYDVILRKTA